MNSQKKKEQNTFLINGASKHERGADERWVRAKWHTPLLKGQRTSKLIIKEPSPLHNPKYNLHVIFIQFE